MPQVYPELSTYAPAILYRGDGFDGLTEDVAATSKTSGWIGPVVDSRTSLPSLVESGAIPPIIRYPEVAPRTVIGRYSVLPYYRELEADLANLGWRLANTHAQHEWIANVSQWAPLLGNLTPETYTSRWDLVPEGAYILKGETNSRKDKWSTHMYAPTKADIPRVFARLLEDSLIGPQGIVARRYYPLKRLGVGINDMPFVHEYRLFYWGTTYLAGGFYWSSFEDSEKYTEVPVEALQVGAAAASIVAEHAQFFVIDVAETESGDWIVIELNDGQMSGLSETDPVALYTALQDAYFSDAFMLRGLPPEQAQRLLDAMRAHHTAPPPFQVQVIDPITREPRGREIVFGGAGPRQRQVFGG